MQLFFDAMTSDPVKQLQDDLGADWSAIRQAHENSIHQRGKLESILTPIDMPDTSMIVLGSLARQEFTDASDIDWVLLLDGQTTPEHKAQERAVKEALSHNSFKEPGRSGLFETTISSHDLVHQIGGADDSNANTTRRMLLLLESSPIFGAPVHQRVRRQILRRYLDDDYGFRNHPSRTRIPRFLLNDITRYWRTITVDYVYKQTNDDGGKWALRNAKLRMSRKLLFASGLITCFRCSQVLQSDEVSSHSDADRARFLGFLERAFTLTPLERMAVFGQDFAMPSEVMLALFTSYNDFLSLLSDSRQRNELEALSPGEAKQSTTWNQVREISTHFHKSLIRFFFEGNPDLAQLTREYGVF